ncbi:MULTISPECIES: ammonium transporter [unclassified Idiomarina]|jgi:Amt family ammonium transporter|uniref:ammonium transporter n=1 Tax=unclassified Idiomarina TaxID=2614829 RepID=UPI000AC6ED02|nr:MULTISPECIES: ammonium transporter [unclassified Idiomarina]MBF37738.1 ammonium transporter [Idiomarinaceae bacterium]MCJ8316301.1 ammonium transporter [Idiomarina sp.]NQZ16214.1 ammonium transporter [Idiomarina sp.]|tara:strand:+ start:3426 stop:4613 length:1188 start_codon:yes stop_codon:yes gene_type:complete
MESQQHLAQLPYVLDTFFLLISGAFVMWMAAGFSMLEAGLVRAKNTTEILTKNITLYALACLSYLFIGYAIMYPNAAPTAHAADAGFFFQMVFVATAMSIVSGVVAERMKLNSFLLFCVALSAFIYPIQGAWSWGGGFLSELGFVDFAGSSIVHLTGASAAFAAVLLLGPRLGKYSKSGAVMAIPGANMPLATLGTLVLWFGWFGFNGGSQLALSSTADANAIASAFVNTNISAAGGTVAAYLFTKVFFKKADLTMILNGALAGLVAITAQPVTPPSWLAAIVGFTAGILVVLSIIFLDKLHIDDPVGAISVHGVVGIFGTLVVPISDSGATLLNQLIGASVILAWGFLTSFVLWGLLKFTIGIRVTKEQEYAGLDKVDCGVEAYPEFIRSPEGQ